MTRQSSMLLSLGPSTLVDEAGKLGFAWSLP
jgi:hypothetical protein